MFGRIKFFRSQLIRINVVNKFLHNTRVLNFKRFTNNEIDFSSRFVVQHDFSEYLLNHQDQKKIEYSESLLISNKSNYSNDEMIQILDVIAKHCQSEGDCISNEKYTKFVQDLVERIPKLTQEEIVRFLITLKKLPQTKHAHETNYQDLWETLDEVCRNNVTVWKSPYLLKLCALWNNLYLARNSNFVFASLRKVARQIGKYSAGELVEFMFYVSICRKDVEMLQVEKRMLEVFDDFTIHEIGVLCGAFFKSQKKIKSFELISRIFDKLIKDIDLVSEITLAGILKNLRYCSDVTHSDKLDELNYLLANQVQKHSLMCSVHMALLGTNLQCYNQTLMENIVERFNNSIKEARAKDLERIVMAISLYNFKARDGSEKILLNKIIEEIKLRAKEFGKHPKSLTSLVHFLTICGVYDLDILKSIMTEKFILFTYGKNHFAIGREMLCLDSYVKINLKGIYDGPVLSDKMRINITRFTSYHIPQRIQKWKLTMMDKLTLDFKEELESTYGAVKVTHILPQYQIPDLVLCFDKNGNSVTKEILDCFPEDHSGTILSKEYLLSRKPEFKDKIDDYELVTVIIGGWNLLIRNTGKLTGGLELKVNQLKLIGHRPVVMIWSDWAKTKHERGQFILHSLIQNALKNSNNKQEQEKILLP